MQTGITPTIDSISKKFNQGVKKLTKQQDKIKKNMAKRLLGSFSYDKFIKKDDFKKAKHEQYHQFAVDFDQRFKNTFNLVLKKERLNFVKYSAPRRLINAGVSTLVTGISLLATATIAAPITVALPVLTTIGMIFSCGVMANSFQIYRKQQEGADRINKVTNDIKKAAGPDFQTFKQNKKHMQKLDKEAKKRMAQQTEQQPQLIKRRWYKPLRTQSPINVMQQSENTVATSLSEQKSDITFKSTKNK